jgi:hypothetical protein
VAGYFDISLVGCVDMSLVGCFDMSLVLEDIVDRLVEMLDKMVEK